jgi:PAS domain S-box-containing protein
MENEFSRIVDALPGLIWTARPGDGHTDFVNQRWCEYTGMSAEEACGQGWQAVIHPEDLAALFECWRASLASGAPAELEARMRRFDGVYRWFLFRTDPLLDASGRIVKWCGINTDVEDRRRAEDALRVHERRFGLIIEGLPALVVLLTPGGEVESVNRQVLEFTGVSLEELKGWATSDLVHPADRPHAVARWAQSIETGQPCDLEARHRRADGVYRWLHVRGLPLRDTEGRTVLWYLLLSDVDDRKRAEALLAGEKRLLEMVAWGQPLPVVLDALCRLFEESASGSYCRIVPDAAFDTQWDAHGWRSPSVVHGLRSFWSSPILSRSQQTLGTFVIYRREPGNPTAFEQDLIGKITHIAGIAIERALGDAALKRSEAFLAQAQRLSSTGSFSWRVGTGEISWSEEVYRIYGLDPALPLTRELIYSRIHPEDLPFINERAARARSGEAVDFGYEHRLRMPDGSVKYLHTIHHGTRDHEGRLEYIGAIQDVTERRRSEETLGKVRSELAHVARVMSLGALTASIAHEVSQPLSGIITNASTCLRMLAADPPNVDGALETARRTIRDGNRASEVITRLRGLFGKKAPTSEPMDLNEAAREVIALSLSELQRNRVTVRQELAENLPPVTGDRVQLQQVILNLLLNASDAMSGIEDRPRQVVIRTERDEGEGVRLAVRDAGVGFEPQDRDKLFNAFYTTKRGGMGIGLSVSRSIVESHGGRLWAAPNDDGHGATFSFSIPRLDERAAADARHSMESFR